MLNKIYLKNRQSTVISDFLVKSVVSNVSVLSFEEVHQCLQSTKRILEKQPEAYTDIEAKVSI